jgi:hypothetical protein
MKKPYRGCVYLFSMAIADVCSIPLLLPRKLLPSNRKVVDKVVPQYPSARPLA